MTIEQILPTYHKQTFRFKNMFNPKINSDHCKRMGAFQNLT